jgi:hypothetical protein
MAKQDEHQPRIVSVDGLQGGDHAVLTPADTDAQWQVLTAYTWEGLARDEKILIVLDPNDLSDDAAVARMDDASSRVASARDSGQLELARNTSVYLPDGRFDKQRTIAGFTEEIERSRREGWLRMRAAGDMSWVLLPWVDPDDVLDYEMSVGPVFADRRFTALCWYDQRRFSDHVVASAREIHPVQLMDRLHAIDVTPTPTGMRIAGSAELSTREEFTEALRAALEGQACSRPLLFELDLTDLSFMEAFCASRLIGFIASLPEGSKVTVRCGPVLEPVLRGLGSDTVPQLELSVEEE